MVATRTADRRLRIVRALCAMIVAAAPALVSALEVTLPRDSSARFLGTETCGSSQCHGSVEPWRNATVLMKERRIWEHADAHAGAYRALASESARRIARNLGLADATSAAECLGCHATAPPVAQRGPAFRLEQGVGCESCHGPGGAFLRTHVQSTSSHRGNLAAGMYPTTDPRARAHLCLSCHQGDAKQPMSHRLYGAGHPRLRFELDTYGVLQPYHYVIDADYRRRKPAASHFALWAAGQVEAARLLLTDAGGTGGTGLFPELAHYDCHGCHRPIGDGSRARGAAPPRFAAAPLTLVRALSEVVDPAGTAGFAAALQAFESTHQAGGGERFAALAAALERLATQVRAHAGDEHAGGAALVELARTADHAPPGYAVAEALAMSLSTLLLAEQEAGRIDGAAFARANAALDGVYAALVDEHAYRPEAFAAALATFRATLSPVAGEAP